MIVIYNGTSYVWEDLDKDDKELMRDAYLKALAKKNIVREQQEIKEPDTYYKPKKKRK